MNNASAFREMSPRAKLVEVRFDDVTLSLPEGENLAAALLAAGYSTFRVTPVSGSPRGPFCMMGACFDCLVEIGGATVQACMSRVEAGTVISLAHGRKSDESL